MTIDRLHRERRFVQLTTILVTFLRLIGGPKNVGVGGVGGGIFAFWTLF